MRTQEIRYRDLQQWLKTVLEGQFEWHPMTPGAGKRRYFRLAGAGLVVMDAPVDEKCKAFVQLASEFRTVGVQTPHVHAADLHQGFLLLTDFGDELYYRALNHDNADSLYRQALATLLCIQTYASPALSPFDMVYYREKMAWFNEFYLQRYLNFSLSAGQRRDSEALYDLLIDTAERQPAVCVHYDYHSRNLVHLSDGQVGVLDFQDAVCGPITYDLMSLLRDCYRDWPWTRVQRWLQEYQQLALAKGVLAEEDPALWLRWCDFSTVQRHLKCIGLFARFHILGHSSEYLNYIPRSLHYLREIAYRYKELSSLQTVLEKLA